MPTCGFAQRSVWALCSLFLVGVSVAPPACAGDDALRARYGAAMRESIQKVWRVPDGMPAGARCRLTIEQLSGDAVVAVDVLPDCAFDDVPRGSLLRAFQLAAPLSYVGFEPVFSRNLTITFTSLAR